MSEPLLPTVDDPARVIIGDSLEVLRRLPDGCVSCCVTSPPYWSLRDYGTGRWEGGDAGCDHRQNRGNQSVYGTGQRANRANPGYIPYKGVCGKCGAVRIDQQIGLEKTPGEFVARLVEVFREVRRVLHPTGILWLNVGDSYNAHPNQRKATDAAGPKQRTNAGAVGIGSRSFAGLKPKDLCGVPWRLAFGLQDDGWYLRAECLWCKVSPMPESVTDRPTRAHEHVFMLTKRPTYFYDQEAERPTICRAGDVQTMGKRLKQAGDFRPSDPEFRNGSEQWGRSIETAASRNLWTYWTDISPSPFPEAHFATFPEALPTRCVRLSSSEKGVCPECWSPWRRVMGRPCGQCGEMIRTQGKSCRACGHVNDWKAGRGLSGEFGTTDWSTPGRATPRRLTSAGKQAAVGASKTSATGWEPSCKCPPTDPIPSLILDPFAGSGTTLAVAVKLKRRALGIELNPDYAALCEKRLAEPLGGDLFAPAAPVVRSLFDGEGQP